MLKGGQGRTGKETEASGRNCLECACLALAVVLILWAVTSLSGCAAEQRMRNMGGSGAR